jgi:hypothetical protein
MRLADLRCIRPGICELWPRGIFDLINAMEISSANLIAGVIWGGLGMGFFVYGKKQHSAGPLFGGIALMGITYFIPSPLIMSLAAVGIIAGIYLYSRNS